MSSIGAREANRSFSRILREAESGKTIVITRNGKPVARLEPAVAKRTPGKAREKAIARMVELMEKGLDFGGRRFTRDELNER